MPTDAELRNMAAAHEAHFIRRAQERLKVKLTPARYRHWTRKVRDVLPGTRYLYKDKDSEHRTCWMIKAGTLRIRVIYDERTDRLVTCMAWHDTEYIPHKRYVRRRRRAVQTVRKDHAAALRRIRVRQGRANPISDFPTPTCRAIAPRSDGGSPISES